MTIPPGDSMPTNACRQLEADNSENTKSHLYFLGTRLHIRSFWGVLTIVRFGEILIPGVWWWELDSNISSN